MSERIVENPNGSKHIVVTDNQGNIIRDIMTNPLVQSQSKQSKKEIHLDYALATGMGTHHYHKK